MVSPPHADGIVKQAHYLNGTHGARATTSSMDEGGPAVIPGGHWQEQPEVVRMTGHRCDLSTRRSVPLRAPLKNRVASPPTMSSTPRQHCFDSHEAAAGRRRPVPPSKVPRRMPRSAIRGVNSAARRSPTMMTTASASKQVTTSWSTSQRPQATASARRDHPWTTSRSSSKKCA
jgi:hypothetical protein